MKKFHPIPGWEKYGISEDGDVCRLVGGVRGSRPGLVLKQHIHKTRGYRTVRLYDRQKQKTFDVHRLMAITFLGGVPDGFHVCHQNGIKTDCRLQNLRIDTASANCMDKVNHGTHNRGEFHYKSKYTQELILQVKKRLLSGEKILDLCREYGMTRSYLSNIKHGYKWGWLEV